MKIDDKQGDGVTIGQEQIEEVVKGEGGKGGKGEEKHIQASIGESKKVFAMQRPVCSPLH